MIYISDSMVATLQSINENAGRLCYKNITRAGNISATSETALSPASNMANPSTTFGWEATSNADQTITITNGNSSEIDYIGLARHNLNQAGLELRIRFQGSTVRDWFPVASTQAVLFLFEKASPSEIQIDIRGGTNPAKIAVVYAGQSVKLQRNIYVGHTPINYGRDRSIINGVSQSGDFIGEIVLTETLSTSVSLQNITPDWYRETLDPFFAQKPRNPCFWAWRPKDYPAEVSYCWVEGNPRPSNAQPNGMMSFDWSFRGIE